MTQWHYSDNPPVHGFYRVCVHWRLRPREQHIMYWTGVGWTLEGYGKVHKNPIRAWCELDWPE